MFIASLLPGQGFIRASLLPGRGFIRAINQRHLTKSFIVPSKSLTCFRKIIGLTIYPKNLLLKTVFWTLGGTFLLKSVYENDCCLMAASLPLKDIIEKADDLYEKLQFNEIYDLLSPYKDSNNDDVLWRLARATYEKARQSDKNDVKKALYAEAMKYLHQALSINDNNFAVHKWMAIIMDCYHSMEGMKARISHLYDMKSHMEKACELKPKDGTSWYVLGMWYYGVADITWYERKAASIFFATPPQASFENALNMFLKAENVEPDFYSKNHLMIGKCLYNLGRKEESIVYFTKAKNYIQKTMDDEDAKCEAEKWLKKL